MSQNLSALFAPSSIVVVGASHDVGSVGNDVVKNLLEGGFVGNTFLVNPKKGKLFGKNVYANISEISEHIDLAIIITPAHTVPNILRECAQKSIRAVMVISAGFREAGKSELEKEIISIARENNIALLGPNCLGILVPGIHLNASFAPLMPARGNIAFLSQSGALCASILDWAREYNIGFSAFVSTGNKAVLTEYELLEYFLDDSETNIIALYVEDLQETEKIITLLKTKNKNQKPIVVLKSGATDEGKQASSSHTGALAGTDEGYEALFRQSGMIRVKNTRELFLALRGFSSLGTIHETNRVAIITNAGGPGVLAADALSEQCLQLAPLSKDSKEALKTTLPTAASCVNPVDVLGDANAERYKTTLATLTNDDAVDSILVILTPQTMTEVVKTAQVIIEVSRITTKPIVVSFLGSGLVRDGVRILKEENILVFDHPHDAIFTLSLINRYKQQKIILQESSRAKNNDTFSQFETHFSSAIEKTKQSLFKFHAQDISAIGEVQTLPILSSFGFRTLHTKVAKTADEAKKIAELINSPVVLKIVSPDILHKSDVGGVKLNIAPYDVEVAYKAMIEEVMRKKPGANIEGIAVVEMAPKDGIFMALGMKRDDALGPVVMAGLGGIYVETLRDVAFGVSPLEKKDALTMIQSLRSFPMLNGARGQEKLDVDAFADAIVILGNISRALPDIREIDINPLLILPQGEGVIALDGRIVL